jgi:hypothetical protein
MQSRVCFILGFGWCGWSVVLFQVGGGLAEDVEALWGELAVQGDFQIEDRDVFVGDEAFDEIGQLLGIPSWCRGRSIRSGVNPVAVGDEASTGGETGVGSGWIKSFVFRSEQGIDTARIIAGLAGAEVVKLVGVGCWRV